jgi:NADPH:quinone reductase
MTSAKAARLVEHGSPLDVRTIELPRPAHGEVLVELSHAGLNPVDGYAIAGKVAAQGPLPRTLGGEACGHLDGRRVLVCGEGLGATRDGVFATAAIVPQEAVFELPQGVALEEAAALGVVGLTAWSVVEIAQLEPADRVLVLGGAGGVGQSVISYAAAKGAQVWGQTSSVEKVNAIKEFGASGAIVSDADTLAESIRDLAPSVVIDPLGGGFTASALGALAPRGRLVLFGTSAGVEATIQLQQLYRKQARLLTYAGLIATREQRQIGVRRAIEEFARGRLRIRVGAQVPLDEVNEAFAVLGRREVVGKVILALH